MDGLRASGRQLRESILIRDLYTCQEPGCGKLVGGKGEAHVDDDDGDPNNNDPGNLKTMCNCCHSRKTAREDGGFPRHADRCEASEQQESHSSRCRSGGGEYYTVGVKTGKRRKYANTRRNRRMGRTGKVYEENGWAYYWRHLEFGTKKMAAKPFLTPAGETKGPQAAQVIIDEAWKAIDKLTKARGWK